MAYNNFRSLYLMNEDGDLLYFQKYTKPFILLREQIVRDMACLREVMYPTKDT